MADIGELRAELKTEIGSGRAELKTEIGSGRAELKTDIGGLRAEVADVKRELTEVKVAVARWEGPPRHLSMAR